ncbi:MAG: 4Fe-4S binding protein [Patescibacteria group bacterium]|nr:4Fe-4S binding protein [Patescibacteria group bacterium]
MKTNYKYQNYDEPGGSLKNKTGDWRTMRPVVDKSRCINCAICEGACPEGCILQRQESKKARKQESLKGEWYEADLDYCKGCGLCAEVCPVKCIFMRLEK